MWAKSMIGEVGEGRNPETIYSLNKSPKRNPGGRKMV